jgi:hypothetical protein
MLILAFHRSLSSSLANWLHHAGLDMGHYLMPPAVSNPEGHHEDMLLVDLHDRLLRMNGTDWRFHDSAPFDPAIRQDLLQRYVEHRTATTAGPWGMKDPRTCLFLPAWRQVLGTQGRYLVLLRHWSGSVQSLYRRHSQALAVGSGNTMLHASFWQQPEQAARMWLACQRRVLALLEHAREQCLVVTQQALLAGLPVIDSINTRFGLALNPQTPSPIRHSLAHDRMEESIRERLSPALLDQLEALWQRLLQAADHRAGNESPCWVPDRTQRSDSSASGADSEHILTRLRPRATRSLPPTKAPTSWWSTPAASSTPRWKSRSTPSAKRSRERQGHRYRLPGCQGRRRAGGPPAGAGRHRPPRHRAGHARGAQAPAQAPRPLHRPGAAAGHQADAAITTPT